MSATFSFSLQAENKSKMQLSATVKAENTAGMISPHSFLAHLWSM